MACKFVKYYFPNYKVPGKIITYIGPADGEGDGIGDDAIIVGLHYHLGKDNPLYKSSLVQTIYPEYISMTFEPDYIASQHNEASIVNGYLSEKESDKSIGCTRWLKKENGFIYLSKFLPTDG